MSFVYKGLRATLEKVSVTGEEVDRQLLRLQQQTPRYTQVLERSAAPGDELVLDYAGFCDGVQFPGGTAQRQTLTLGSHTFIPGFEEQLVGANAGEDVTVQVTFPEQYHAAELAGKAAEFRCHIHAIRQKNSYELDDVFAKEVGGVDSFEQMKVKMKEDLQAYYDARSEAELQDRLLRQAAASLNAVFTMKEENAAVDEQMAALEAQLAQRGLDLQAYCQFTGSSEQQLRQDARVEAQQQLRMRKAVEEIARLEDLRAEKAEIDQQIAAVCEENRMTMDELKPYMTDEFFAAVERSVLTYKVMAFLRENASVTEKQAQSV